MLNHHRMISQRFMIFQNYSDCTLSRHKKDFFYPLKLNVYKNTLTKKIIIIAEMKKFFKTNFHIIIYFDGFGHNFFFHSSFKLQFFTFNIIVSFSSLSAPLAYQRNLFKSFYFVFYFATTTKTKITQKYFPFFTLKRFFFLLIKKYHFQ